MEYQIQNLHQETQILNYEKYTSLETIKTHIKPIVNV